MKKALAVVAILALSSLFMIQAGELEPTDPPGPTMVTLQDIYDLLQQLVGPCGDDTGNRFADCGDGTIKDTTTGLFWLKDPSCFGRLDWWDATTAAANLADDQCGLTDGSVPGDWRLPAVDCNSPGVLDCDYAQTTGEFKTLFEPTCPPPFVSDITGSGCWSEGDPFTGLVTNYYWSSAPYPGDINRRWAMDTFTDDASSPQLFAPDMNSINWVWPVRDPK